MKSSVIIYPTEELDVTVEAYVRMVDNGIGPYECHGVRGWHHQWEPEITSEILYDKQPYTNEEQEIINQYIDDHEEQIINDLLENYDDDD